jgi:hypothetical protein
MLPISWSLQCLVCAAVPSSKCGFCFLELLGRDENAFDRLYCVAFPLLDAQWLVKHASYMEFNVRLLVCSVNWSFCKKNF